MTQQEFIKKYGHDSIIDGVLKDKIEYYLTRKRSRLARDFEYPEGITEFGIFFGAYLTPLTNELLTSIPKSVENIGWFGKRSLTVADGAIIRADIRKARSLCRNRHIQVTPVIVPDEISTYELSAYNDDMIRTNPEVPLELKGLRWSEAKNVWEIGETDENDNFTYIKDQTI